MSTDKTTTQTNQYNPASMSTYNALQPGIASVLGPYMQGNPLESPFFAAMRQMGLQQANAMAGRNVNNIFANQSQGGMVGPAQQAALQKQGRISSSWQSDALWRAVQQAYGQQQWATQTAMGHQPLQTGQTQVQKTSGLGTWLPSLIQTNAGMIFGGGQPSGSGPFAGIGAANAAAVPSNLPTGFGNIPNTGGSPNMWGQLPTGVQPWGSGGILGPRP